MRDKATIEIDMAINILFAMASDIEEMERFWPVSRRGSNAQRHLTWIKERRQAALQCLQDAREATK